MNPSLDYIKNRLSLRTPQSESLDVLDDVCDILLSNDNNETKLRKVSQKYSHFKNFDRDFPSLCFSLATGVGKTRLMGAFITYLHIVKNINNFIVIAPNITIYNKLIEDFSNPGNEKYVFRGISEFVQNSPKIVTGDNYKEQGKSEFFQSSITINIFNISKIDSEDRNIKSLNEWLGESYYNYLCELDDLVILMDESHHYRAKISKTVLNEINPVLGLELTATPQIIKGSKNVRFDNIIYDYPLSNAMSDGYVKEPSVATKKDFNADNFSKEELDKIKLIDGLAIHENTKVTLEEYARNHEVPLVKPFTMVVCSNIDHAKEIQAYIESNQFYSGKYKGKVIQIDSKSGKTERDDNVAKLLMLENPLNTIEIVVHVNMLKEGWDVRNLYTIIPLRTSASKTLTEQTMGRGLRLPYGIRTGVEAVDRLTVVAHDSYQAIIDEANKADSILNRSNIVNIEDLDLKRKQLVMSYSVLEAEIDRKIEQATSDEEKANLIVEKKITKIVADKNLLSEDLTKKEVRTEIVSQLEIEDEIKLFNWNDTYNKVIEERASKIVESVAKKKINIPYVALNKDSSFKVNYKNFELDLTKLDFKPLDNSILIKHLGDGEKLELEVDNTSHTFDNVKGLLFEQLNNISSLDYDSCAELLNSKIDEFIKCLNGKYEKDQVINILFNYASYIAKEIARQVTNNVDFSEEITEEPIIKENSRVLNHNYTKYADENILDLSADVNGSVIRSKVFNGFKSACHNIYKFDSTSEKDFAVIIDQDKDVIKWLRPAELQFNIYWNNGTKRYEPDFVVETYDIIYMVEIKRESEIDDTEVQDKKLSAEKYCNVVNEYGKTHNLKKWKYIIIPHTDIKTNYSFERYTSN